jgi:microcystin degradation protein MlrC
VTPVRIAIGQFMEESNTFVRQRADLEQFRATQLLYGDEILPRLRGTRAEVGGFLDVLGPAGVEVIPTVAANAVSSGPVTRSAFDHVKDAILERLAAAGRLDGVLLALHGAMVLEDAPDGEGELLAAVRKAIGPAVPLVATLDLHATITARMVEEADALIGYDTYPHIDLYETGAKAATLILRAARGEVRPVTLFARAPMLVPAEGQGTSNQPMAGLMAEAKRLRPGPASSPSRSSPSSPGSTSRHRVLGDGRRRWPSARGGDRARGSPARLAGLGAPARLRGRPPERR